MEKAESVVFDTAAFYALVAQEDRYHQQAHATYDLLVLQGYQFHTTSYAIVETQALVMRRLGFNAVQNIMEVLMSSLNIVWVTRGEHQAAWEQFVRAEGAGLSLVDWTVALAARQLGATVFTFDSDFARAGFEVIPSP